MLIDEDDPLKSKFMLKWKHKLEIGDCNVYIQRNKERYTKELIVSYKTIY